MNLNTRLIEEMTKSRFGNSVKPIYKTTSPQGWYLVEIKRKTESIETFMGRNKKAAYDFLIKIPERKRLFGLIWFNFSGFFSRLVGAK